MTKKKPKKKFDIEVNKEGRPTVMTPAVVQKLEQAFAIDATIEEACSYAGIARQTYYDYIEKNPEFSDRIADLRNRPVLKARQTVVQKLGESYGSAMDYLKRKRKQEFGDTTDITTGGEKISTPSSDVARIAYEVAERLREQKT